MLDEPTSNLDLFHQIKMMNAIKKLSIEGVGIFMILHDLNLAFKYSDYIAILKNGKIVNFGEPMSIINDDVLSNTFGVKIQVNKKDDNIFINYVKKI
jgi:iron complex transport system ATP-binding protein